MNFTRRVFNEIRNYVKFPYGAKAFQSRHHVKRYKPNVKLPLPPFIAMGIWGIIKTTDPKEATKSITTKEVLLAKSDALFEQGEYKQIYDLLSNYKDDRDVEILWRLARALYNWSKTASEVEAKKMVFEAYDLISTALEINEEHYAVHKWISILLDSKSSYEGMKARVRELYNVKRHMLRAVELNPKDSTTLYMLGTWCFEISNLAWYQRKLATAIFGAPPTSTFEEALNYFETAERQDPKFYSLNLLMLGKTYMKLNRKDEAIKYLRVLSNEFLARNDEDHKAKQEAIKLLSSISP